MEPVRSRRPYAVTWDPKFSNSHPQRSAAALQPLIAPKGNADTELTNDEIINTFINHDCNDDLDRYCYRKQTLLEFVKGVDVRKLGEFKSSLISSACALVVDHQTDQGTLIESKDAQHKVETTSVIPQVALAANQLLPRLEEHVCLAQD